MKVNIFSRAVVAVAISGVMLIGASTPLIAQENQDKKQHTRSDDGNEASGGEPASAPHLWPFTGPE